MIFFLSLYCLTDLLLWLRFRIRLKPSHFSLLRHPASFFSSGKWLIPPFALATALLLFFPWAALALIFFAPWPHPFLTAYREIRRKNPIAASFPLSSRHSRSPPLFHIPAEDNPHILFIVLESFRAKNVGCLGAKLPLSPHFDALAEKGILFYKFPLDRQSDQPGHHRFALRRTARP